MNGWFITGSKAGDKLDGCLKLMMKDKDEFQEGNPSKPMLIKDRMEFGLAGDYVF